MKTEKIEVRVSKDEKDWIELIADDNKITKSELVMRALKYWVMSNYPKEKYKKWIV